MKRSTGTTILVMVLALSFLGLGFGPLAYESWKPAGMPAALTAGRDFAPTDKGRDKENASRKRTLKARAKDRQDESEIQDLENENDPDRPPFAVGINEAEYLRLREEHIARLRGWEPGRPFDPKARGRAIKRMEERSEERRVGKE